MGQELTCGGTGQPLICSATNENQLSLPPQIYFRWSFWI